MSDTDERPEPPADSFFHLAETKLTPDLLFRTLDQDEVLARACQFLREARADVMPVDNLACALRAIVYGHETGVLSDVPDDVRSIVHGLLFEAQERVLVFADGRISRNATQYGIGAAISLLNIGPRRTVRNILGAVTRADHVMLLVNELDTLVRRQRIEACGDLFRRTTKTLTAQQAVHDGAPLH